MYKLIKQFKYLKNNSQFLTKLNLSKNEIRNFLSQSYYCNEVWSERLKAPLLQNVKLDDFYYELEQNYQNTKNISAVDVDVFVNSGQDEEHLQEARDLIHKLRLSADCINMLPSTGHATIRLFLDANKTSELMEMVDDRLNYGIFLSSFEANMLMDQFIKNKMYSSAAWVATQFMLQEDFSHDLTTKFSALSCILYLKNPQDWPIKESTPEPESKEEIKVRVKFLRNPYFDDHFDIRNPKHLVGKTLKMLGSKDDSALGNSLKILGLALYEKIEEMTIFIDKLKNEQKSILREVLTLLKDEKVPDTVSSIVMIDGNLEEILKNQLKESEKVWAERDIAEQSQLYFDWEKKRMDTLNLQKERVDRIKRLKNVEEIKKSLTEEERKLWFFDNEEKIELQIDSNIIYYRKRWFGKKKKPRVIDEDYVPPEAIQRRIK